VYFVGLILSSQQILLVPLTHATRFGRYLVIVSNDLNM